MTSYTLEKNYYKVKKKKNCVDAFNPVQKIEQFNSQKKKMTTKNFSEINTLQSHQKEGPMYSKPRAPLPQSSWRYTSETKRCFLFSFKNNKEKKKKSSVYSKDFIVLNSHSLCEPREIFFYIINI